MKYYVYAIRHNKGVEDEFIKLITEDKEEAIKEAKEQAYFDQRDGNKGYVEIRVYTNDDECGDYNTIDF